MTEKPLSAILSPETGPGTDSTPDPGKSGSGEAGPVSGAVPAKSQADIELKVIRDICRREGHGRFVEVTSPADHPFCIHWCRRGCGTRVVDAPRGLTVPELWQVMERLGMTAAKVDEASFVLDPIDESSVPAGQDRSSSPGNRLTESGENSTKQAPRTGGLVDSSCLHHAGEHLGACRDCTCADLAHNDWGCQTSGCLCFNNDFPPPVIVDPSIPEGTVYAVGSCGCGHDADYHNSQGCIAVYGFAGPECPCSTPAWRLASKATGTGEQP